MAVLYTPHFVQFEDDNGDPLSGGKLYSYAAGTTTPKATYTTADGDIEHANPIILDSAGRAVVFIQGSYRFDLYDSDDNLIRSTDDVTSFTTLPESSDSFFQSFSGDGNNTVFTLSTDLGTDEKSIMVFVDDGLNEYVTNGGFETDSDWTKGSGWVIGSGVATATTASTALSQSSSITLIEGQSYNITYTITRSAGSITPSIGGTNGESRNSAGTYTETIIAGSSQMIALTGSGFTGTVDNVTITNVQPTGTNVLNPNQYTLDGTSLSFVTAPPVGVNNVLVFAPSELVGAASASAAAAQIAEEGAISAKNEAEIAAGIITITSASSVTLGTGSKTFTVDSGLSLTAGQWAIITSDANPTVNYMTGQITSYSSTDLIVNVSQFFGSGMFDDWTIRLSGVEGETGATGTVTATSSVTAATSAGASLKSNTGDDCASWGAGSGQNFTITNTLTFGAGGSTVSSILDEDDMSSDSDTALATQQSIKAYVDNSSPAVLLNADMTGTPTINYSRNVSSITDNGTGDYTINFTTAFSNTNYVAVYSTGRSVGTVTIEYETARSTSGITIKTYNDAGGAVDVNSFNLIIHGELS